MFMKLDLQYIVYNIYVYCVFEHITQSTVGAVPQPHVESDTILGYLLPCRTPRYDIVLTCLL